jgi:hypothetical protein
MRGILTVSPSLSPIAITWTDCMRTLVTHTCELLAKPRPLIARVMRQISPIFNISL